MRESHVERLLREGVERLGGICEKHVSPQRNGVPDRIVSWPGGLTHWIETKAPAGKLSGAQERDHKRRKRLGHKVYVLWDPAEVSLYLAHMMFKFK